MDSLLANFQIVFETLGCRLNQVETEAAMNFFSASCFPVFVNSAPDIKNENVLLYVLNTCAVTQKAEQKAFRQIKKILEKYKNATLLVTGCYAELSKDFIKNIDKRIAVIPGKKKSFISRVPTILKECVTDFNPEIFSNKIENLLDDKLFQNNPFVFSPVSFFSHSRASLKIQDGCNSACTYCAIRLARGASTSLSVEEVLERVVKLEESGQNEVVFTAVNLAHYRSAYKNETYNFEKLLALLLQKTQNIAFRISSVYPELISESFCKIIESKRVRPHFHISVQSGSDKILSLMGRKYRKSDVIKCVSLLRKAKQNPFIACDLIAGFPSETDDDFEETLDLCKICNFAYIHAFPFSARPGTIAFNMENKVSQEVSKNRVKLLSDFALDQKIQYVNSCVGKEFDAIREKNLTDNSFRVLTENFLHCIVYDKNDYDENRVKFSPSQNLLPGQKLRIRINDVALDEIKQNRETEAFASLV